MEKRICGINTNISKRKRYQDEKKEKGENNLK